MFYLGVQKIDESKALIVATAILGD